MNLNYKFADQSDSEALIKVGSKLFDNEIIPESLNEFLSDNRHFLLLAYDEKEIVGMVSGLKYIHPDKLPAMFINEASVLESYQNKGIGTSLIKQFVAFSKKMNCADIWVATEFSNNSARKAYKKAGGVEDIEPAVVIVFE